MTVGAGVPDKAAGTGWEATTPAAPPAEAPKPKNPEPTSAPPDPERRGIPDPGSGHEHP